MMRVNLESVPTAVQEFIRGLPHESGGIELAFGDRVVWKLVPPKQLSDQEKSALLARGKALLRESRERNEAVSGREVEREIQDAMKTVRGADQ